VKVAPLTSKSRSLAPSLRSVAVTEPLPLREPDPARSTMVQRSEPTVPSMASSKPGPERMAAPVPCEATIAPPSYASTCEGKRW
jgi:hypothetical protein